MKRTSVLRLAAACTVFWLAASTVRADAIAWSSKWLSDPHVVWDDDHDASVRLSHTSAPHPLGSFARLVASRVRSFSGAGFHHPDHFTDQPFSLTIVIHDPQNGKSGSLTFNGSLNGTLWHHGADLTVTMSSPLTQTLHLNHQLYQVTLIPPDQIHGPGHLAGTFFASIKISHNPEPSTLVLAALGTPALGLTFWRRRKGRQAANLTI
jgi:hypothetical protein